MNKWRKGIAQWTVRDTLYLSVVFTWDLPEAKRIAAESKKKVIAGGPAVMAMPDYLKDVAKVEQRTIFPALAYHNPMATFTTRGCPNRCSFCTVPRIEGDFRELDTWEPRPLVCDNNLLAASSVHFRRVINSLKELPFVDFNQGLDARLFTDFHARAIAELPHVKMRFAFDHANQEKYLARAIERAKAHGLKDISVYVLIGFEDTPEDALYRLSTVLSLGALPFPQRFQPLYSLEKNSYLADGWTDYEMRKMVEYWSHIICTRAIPYDEFNLKNIGRYGQGVLI